jgi:hypothetical protein
MGRFKTTLGAGAMLAFMATGLLSAQGPTDRSTIVTFSAPVSLPGITLPAGSYLFKLADTQATRNVVQIYDKDRTKIFTTLITVSAQRNDASDESVVTFKETPADRPPAVHYWYYAGEKAGHEFAYPKAQAMEIARTSHEPVLAVASSSTDIDEMTKGEISRIDPAQAEPQAAAPPAPEPVQPAMAEQTAPAPTGTSGRTATTTELPKTASELPLVGLVGLLALGGALIARSVRGRLAQ